MKIEIKSILGVVLFEYENDNNTTKKTIEKAIEANADLSSANLRSADLSYANLSYANLRSADLSSANLSEIKINEMTAFYSICCPEEGAFIGYKKAFGKIIKLQITENALRSSATSLKCRCSEAIVLEIEGGLSKVCSDYDVKFIYRVGELVKVENFDINRWNECSTGIHFFMNKENAKQY